MKASGITKITQWSNLSHGSFRGQGGPSYFFLFFTTIVGVKHRMVLHHTIFRGGGGGGGQRGYCSPSWNGIVPPLNLSGGQGGLPPLELLLPPLGGGGGIRGFPWNGLLPPSKLVKLCN